VANPQSAGSNPEDVRRLLRLPFPLGRQIQKSNLAAPPQQETSERRAARDESAVYRVLADLGQHILWPPTPAVVPPVGPHTRCFLSVCGGIRWSKQAICGASTYRPFVGQPFAMRQQRHRTVSGSAALSGDLRLAPGPGPRLARRPRCWTKLGLSRRSGAARLTSVCTAVESARAMLYMSPRPPISFLLGKTASAISRNGSGEQAPPDPFFFNIVFSYLPARPRWLPDIDTVYISTHLCFDNLTSGPLQLLTLTIAVPRILRAGLVCKRSSDASKQEQRERERARRWCVQRSEWRHAERRRHDASDIGEINGSPDSSRT
jgi:hypothetical protein